MYAHSFRKQAPGGIEGIRVDALGFLDATDFGDGGGDGLGSVGADVHSILPFQFFLQVRH